MAAMSLRGYWRTLIVFIACKPAMRMTKLTTIASTGRLMKRSVKDFMSILGSRIYRRRIHLRFRREIIVDRYRHSIAQFENSRAHDGFIRFQPVDNRNEIAACFAHPNKLLTNRLRFLAALRVLLFLDHKNLISKRRVSNPRTGNNTRLLFCRRYPFEFGNRSGSKRLTRI